MNAYIKDKRKPNLSCVYHNYRVQAKRNTHLQSFHEGLKLVHVRDNRGCAIIFLRWC